MQVQFIIHLMCVHDIPSDSFSIQQVWRKHLIFLMFVSPFYCFSCTAQFTALYVPQPILLLCITCGSLGSIAGRLKYFGMLSCINLQHPRFESYCTAVCINICSEHIRLFFFLPHTELYTTQTNVNTHTRCHVILPFLILPFYLHHVRPFST